MLEHVLIAVDGSSACGHVVTHGFELAAQLGARVTLLHVLEELGVPFVQYGMEPYVDLEAVSVEVLDAHREAADRLVRDAVAGAPTDLVVDGLVREAAGRRTAEVIAEVAAELGADLIVVGTHGHRGLSRVFLGSVADGVVRVADVPVTLVRYHEHEGDGPHAPG